eukprot:bmy_02880T0
MGEHFLPTQLPSTGIMKCSDSNCCVPRLTLKLPYLSKFRCQKTHSSPYPKPTMGMYRKLHRVQGNFLCVSRMWVTNA